MDVLVSLLVLLGAGFVAIAALGLLRMPDLYVRMHAVAKAGTLGCGLVLLGVAIFFGGVSVTLRVIGAVVFLLATAPVAGHLIGRAAHRTGVPMSPDTVCDERDGPV